MKDEVFFIVVECLAKPPVKKFCSEKEICKSSL